MFYGPFSHSMWDPEMNEISLVKSGASQVALVVKNPPAKARDVRDTGSIPAGQCSPVFLPRESHGQRSLAGYSPWGRKELGMTEVT